MISDGSGISTNAVGDVLWSKTYKVSYAKSVSPCSSGSSNFTIATCIITCVAAASGVTIATSPAVVVALISGSLTVIQKGLKSKSSKHGVRATVQKVEIQKYQGGRKVKGYSYKIKSVGTY